MRTADHHSLDPPALTSVSRRRLLVAVVIAAIIVFTSPWIGAARSAVRAAIPGAFLIVLNMTAIVLALGALAWAWRAIRDGRLWRRAALVAAIALAAVVATSLAGPSAEANATERFHFFEYGLVAWFFYRAMPRRTRGFSNEVALCVLAGLLVSTADEAFQWFVPNRVGELRDIFINLGAIAAGLLFSVAVDPPEAGTSAAGISAVAGTAAAVMLALAAFLQTVQLGFEIHDPDIGTFRSRYPAQRLLELEADRTTTWRVTPPPTTLHRLSREDQFLAEGLAHVQARNRAWETNIRASWLENRILEKYFAPVLVTPSYLTPAAAKWPDAQRRDVEQRASTARADDFESVAWRDFVLIWPASTVWAVAVSAAALLVALAFARRP